MSLCPKCGKPSRGLCLECYFEDNPLELGDVKISFCGYCNSIRYREHWGASIDDVSKDVRKGIKLPFEVKLSRVEVKPELDEKNLTLNVVVEGDYKGSRFRKDLSNKTRIHKMTCPNCSRKSGGYFEAVLQLRCDIPDLLIDEHHIAKVVPVKGGLDYYLMSNNYAKSIATKLKRKGFIVKDSNKFYSRKEGRDIYRVCYSIKKEE